MLICYSVTLDYFVGIQKTQSLFKSGGFSISITPDTDVSVGLTGFLVFLIIFELCLSSAAIVYSCKAYSKCCNTFDANDCYTCIGCGCETCDGCCGDVPHAVSYFILRLCPSSINPGYIELPYIDRFGSLRFSQDTYSFVLLLWCREPPTKSLKSIKVTSVSR